MARAWVSPGAAGYTSARSVACMAVKGLVSISSSGGRCKRGNHDAIENI